MPAYGNSSSATVPGFRSTGGGSFVKPPQLIGELIILAPVEMEKVPGYNAKPGQPLKDRLTADTIVLTGDLAGEYPGMWWNQANLVKQARRILGISDNDAATGYDQTGPKLDEVLAGRLYRRPKREFKDEYPTKEALEQAFEVNAKLVPTTAYSWVIEPLDDDDRATVTAYYENGRKSPEPEDTDDPFGD